MSGTSHLDNKYFKGIKKKERICFKFYKQNSNSPYPNPKLYPLLKKALVTEKVSGKNKKALKHTARIRNQDNPHIYNMGRAFRHKSLFFSIKSHVYSSTHTQNYTVSKI